MKKICLPVEANNKKYFGIVTEARCGVNAIIYVGIYIHTGFSMSSLVIFVIQILINIIIFKFFFKFEDNFLQVFMANRKFPKTILGYHRKSFNGESS